MCHPWSSYRNKSKSRIKTTDPLRLVNQTVRRNRNWLDSSRISLTRTQVAKIKWKISLLVHEETDRFFLDSRLHLGQSTSGQFHYLRTVFSSYLESKVDNILVRDRDLRIILNIDDSPITSKSHSHPSHSQTSRLLTSSPSLSDKVSQFFTQPSVCETCGSFNFSVLSFITPTLI
jgi:hypothetical protein